MKEELEQSNSLLNEQRESASAHKATALTFYSSWQWERMKLERQVEQAERKTQEVQTESIYHSSL